jgi:hypothetical protein
MKRLGALLTCLVIVGAGWSLEIDKPELTKAAAGELVFENFEGAPAKVETLDQIRGIGRFLATRETAYYDRYEVIRVIDPANPKGFDAEIFIIKPLAGVDHIRNLRHIVAGYLEAAHGYSAADAMTLAEFITVYNAVYRGNLEYFKSVYKTAVIAGLDKDRAGLSRSYKDWPGRTRMLIPLSQKPISGTNAPEPAALVTPAVVKDLQESDSKGLEERKAMVELQDRQLRENKKIIAEENKSIAVEKKAVAETEAKIAAELKAIEAAPMDPKALARKEELKLESTKLETKKEELLVREKKVESAIVAESAKEAAIQNQREEIARDQQKVIDAKKAAVGPKGLPFFLTREGNSPRGTLVAVDPANGAVLAASGLVLAGPERVAFADGLVFIGSAGGTGRLTLVDIETWKSKLVGREEAFEQSKLATADDGLFAVIKDAGAWFVGRYDRSLTLTAKSAVKVNPYTDLVMYQDSVLVQDQDGKILSLAARTLAPAVR